MNDNLYKEFCSYKNLELAYTRLKTSQNTEYKNYYRNVFISYDITVKKNLLNLSQRLSGHSYKIKKTLKFFIPKPNGLLRTITYLSLDDLIVYQGFTNIIAKKISKRRKIVENFNVFSNILNSDEPNSIFFFSKWQIGYKEFKEKIKDFFINGDTWVASFDIAAYYDSIDHGKLCKLISPKNSYTTFCSFIEYCLKNWAQDISHGIPQGPISSNLLGETYLLKIDEKMKKNNIKYIRYVDDIRIFGKSRKEVLEGILYLDIECKALGLIPQSSKHEIIEAESIEQAIGKFPSLTNIEKEDFRNGTNTEKIFHSIFNGKDIDFSKLKYLLKISNKNDDLLNFVLNNLNERPEFTNEFCIFLSNYSEDEELASEIFKRALEDPLPYKYIEGKYWELLANFSIDPFIKNDYMDIAIKRLMKNHDQYFLKLGIYKFMASTENRLILSWLINEESWFIQMLVFPHISTTCFDHPDFLKLMNKFLTRGSYEPALVSIKDLYFGFREDIIQKFNKTFSDDSGVLNNVLGNSIKIDPIGEILKDLYQINSFKNWDKFFTNDYKQANLMLFLAKLSYYIDKNSWASYMNSFNDIVIRSFIKILKKFIPNITWPTTNDKNGLVEIGRLVNDKQLIKNYPNIIIEFKEFNERRRAIPTSHAFEKKTGIETKNISKKEQEDLIVKLRKSYSCLIIEMKKFI